MVYVGKLGFFRKWPLQKSKWFLFNGTEFFFAHESKDYHLLNVIRVQKDIWVKLHLNYPQKDRRGWIGDGYWPNMAA